MPTKIPGYHAKWVAKRRAAFFVDKRCVRCGSTKKLELDHVDPETKVSHCIWSWRESRRAEEISKCQVLCNKCHRKKTAEEMRQLRSGVPNEKSRKLSDEAVASIRLRLSGGERSRPLAKEFGVTHVTINRIRNYQSYRFPIKKDQSE